MIGRSESHNYSAPQQSNRKDLRARSCQKTYGAPRDRCRVAHLCRFILVSPVAIRSIHLVRDGIPLIKVWQEELAHHAG